MAISSYEHFRVTLDESCKALIVEFNHGKANEFGSAQLAELSQVAVDVRSNTDIRTLIVFSSKQTRSGKRVFVSGANVTERVGWTDEQVKAHVHKQRGILLNLRSLPVFTILLIDGLSLGLGTELTLTADWRIGTNEARLGLPETGLGIVPGALGAADLASQIGLSNALYLGMTGEIIDVSTALRMGLLNEHVDSAKSAMERALKIAGQVCTRSAKATAAFKAVVKAGAGLDLEARVSLESQAYESLVDGGEAAIGRENFKLIREGKTPPWPPRDAG